VADPAPLTDGELWSRELLADLRSENYRPHAWLGFLARSFERAGRARRARPALARQARSWGIAGAIITVRAGRAAGVSASACLAWWGLCWAMLDWHLGMVEGPGGQRRERLSLADALTLGRLALVPLVAAPARRPVWSVVVAAGGASDVLDGRLARRAGTTRLGRELDSAADSAFFSAAAVGAARAGWASPAAALAPVARHAAGVAFVALGWFARGSLPDLEDRTTRWLAAPSAAGLLLAAAGTRRAADATLTVASVAALATQARSIARARPKSGGAVSIRVAR